MIMETNQNDDLNFEDLHILELPERLSYDQRERLKRKGWDLYRNGPSIFDKLRGAVMIGVAHFHRSKESIEGQGLEHPSFDEYARHWLWANGDDFFAGEPLRILNQMFRKPLKPHMTKNSTYWDQ